MNKVFRRIFLFISLTVFAISLVVIANNQASAQEYNQAFSKYSDASENYRKTHDEYILARSQYLKFGTLTSQNNAKDATINMLQSRDEVVIAYLTAVKEKINETKGVEDAIKESLNFRLNEETTWFSNHKDKQPSAGTLDDLVSDSDDASERFTDITPLIYEALFEIASGKVNDFQERLNKVFEGTRIKVNQIKEEDREEYKFSTRKVQLMDRWVLETENRAARSEEKQQEAYEKITTLASESRDKQRIYNEALVLLNESQQYMKEASSFVKEIIREIKTAE